MAHDAARARRDRVRLRRGHRPVGACGRGLDDVPRRARERRRAPPRRPDVPGGGPAPRRRRGRRRAPRDRGARAARPRRAPRAAADRARGWPARRRAGPVGPGPPPSPHRRRARRRPPPHGTDPGDRVRRDATTGRRPADHRRAHAVPRDRVPKPGNVRLRRAPQAGGHPRHGSDARRSAHAGRRLRAALAGADQAGVAGGDLTGVAADFCGSPDGPPAGRADRAAVRARRGLPPRRRLSRPRGVRLQRRVARRGDARALPARPCRPPPIRGRRDRRRRRLRGGRRTRALDGAQHRGLGFAAVVGPEPSVLRAVVMAVLVLAALLLEREASVTNSLALAALATLAVHPGDLRDPGFQLSFAATAGIVAAPMPRGVIAGAIAISAAAQRAVLPITLTHFNQLLTIGVVANLAVVPLAGVATVAGLLAVGVAFLSAGAAQVAFDAVWPLLLALRALVALAATVPGALVPPPAPN